MTHHDAASLRKNIAKQTLRSLESDAERGDDAAFDALLESFRTTLYAMERFANPSTTIAPGISERMTNDAAEMLEYAGIIANRQNA